MQAWVGKPEADLVAAMGAPARVYDAGPDRIITYIQIGSGLYGSGGMLYGGTYSCVTSFAIREHVVRTYAIRGDACGWF